MSTSRKTKEVYLEPGFGALVASDVHKRFLDYSGDVATGVDVSSCAFTVYDPDDAVVTPSPIASPTYPGSAQVHFILTVPATAGAYWLKAKATMDSGEAVTHWVDFTVVA